MAAVVRKHAGYPGVVVAQALYMEDHRYMLELRLARWGIEAQFIWVRVGLRQNIRQLWTRPRPLRWVLYWLMSKPFFQEPRGVPVLT